MHYTINTIKQFEDTLTQNQWDLIKDIYNNSGGHMTVRDLVDHHGWSWSDINDLMPTLESLGVCAYDAIHTPAGSKSAIGLYRSTIAVLEDMKAAEGTPEAIRIAELEAEVKTLEATIQQLATMLHKQG
jgi:hypothetical protein